MSVDGYPETSKQVLDPAASRGIEPALAGTLNPNVWVHRYDDAATGWQLSIATHAEPGSLKLSLGGFRIAPESRTSHPGFDTTREAIDLAIGMEEKVYWSRLLGVGGPRAMRASGRVVGGKCVLRPTPDARVGQPRDRELLDWAVACFHDFEASAGVHLNTGQDLGHGVMSDGTTESLAYLNERFAGSVLADTSVPTAEGNFHLLHGMLRGCGLELPHVRVGLVGAGHIGRHVLGLLRERGAEVLVLEASPRARAAVGELGIRTWPAEEKSAFLAQPMDAVVVNAAGGSLDLASVERIVANAAVRVVCGSENLAMPDPRGNALLCAAGKVYCPTELGGMMGYLTAVEQYLAQREGTRFDLGAVLEAARRLEVVGFEATQHVVRGGYRQTFEDAVRDVFGAAAPAGESVGVTGRSVGVD